MSSFFDLFHDDFFKSILDTETPLRASQAETRCPNCGMTYREFNRIGKFGCGQCYEVFSDWVEPLIKRVQGATNYEGSVPMRGSGVFRMQRQLQRLRQQLQKAVDAEDFEQAMVLRDQIRSLEASVKK